MKSLETKVEAYRATSGSVAGTSDARRGEGKDGVEQSAAGRRSGSVDARAVSSRGGWTTRPSLSINPRRARRGEEEFAREEEPSSSRRRSVDRAVGAAAASNKTKATEKRVMSLVSDEDDGDDGLLANILNDVDERAARKRRRPAGSFLKASPNKGARPNSGSAPSSNTAPTDGADAGSFSPCERAIVE